MEKIGPGSIVSSRSQSLLKKYHQLTSPIVTIQTLKQRDCIKNNIQNNAGMKIDCLKNRSTKIYAFDTNIQFSQLKANAILYQIPQFSTPEINYEVADQIKNKVEAMKNEIIKNFPQISKSSNYAPKKIDHQLSHRSVVRELEEWLKDKLKKPPQNYEESVDYKNMIMGIGMKELIRIIGRRCDQEGRIAEEIWELTWSICRQIILYLSKRAKKCEDLLEEELVFMRDSYGKQFQKLKQQKGQMITKVANLQSENKEFFNELSKLRKRWQVLEDENKTLTFDNYYTRNQFKNVLEQNLAIYLQIGEKNKRDWIKKMYKSIVMIPESSISNFKQFFKREVRNVVEERIKQEKIIEDCPETINQEQIEEIQNLVTEKRKNKKQNKKTINKTSINRKGSCGQITMMTEPINQITGQIFIPQTTQYESSQSSCTHFINNLREQFKPIDMSTQTQQPKMADVSVSTIIAQYCDKEVSINPTCLNIFQQMGINTEEIKGQVKVNKKYNTKQTSKQEKPVKGKSKIYLSPPIFKDKAKTKNTKKSVLEVVKEQIQQIQERKSQYHACNSSNNLNISSEIIHSLKSKESLVDTELDQISLQKQTSIVESPKILVEQQHFLNITNIVEQQRVRKQEQVVKFTKKEEQKHTLKIQIMQQQKIGDNYRNDMEEDIGFINFTSKNKATNDCSYVNSFSNKYIQNFIACKDIQDFHSICSESVDEIKQHNLIHTQISKQQAEIQCQMFICAECSRIINSNQDKFMNPKLQKNNLNKKIYRQSKDNIFIVKNRRSELPPFQRSSQKKSIVSPQKYLGDELGFLNKNKNYQFQGRKSKRHFTRNSGDIIFKKNLDDQMMKSNFHSNVIEDHHFMTESDDMEKNFSCFQKMSLFKLMYFKMIDLNKDSISLIMSTQQTIENLQNYSQMVKQINSLPQDKIMMSEKTVVATIEKSIFPIINELMAVVRKAVKFNHITETMKMFTSLPNIIYNRINRKYGVKILAIKNLKIILIALKAANRYTEKYKIIELMMFTDCKSPHSEDLFMYLLVMGLINPNFSSNKTLTLEDIDTIKALCEKHLTQDSNIFVDLGILSKGRIQLKKNDQIIMVDFIKSIITNYRLSKISRIEQLGFIFFMLKKDYWMQYKIFVYFISSLDIDNKLKVKIVKKLLEYCDVKNRDHKVGITYNMYSKFLMECRALTFHILQSSAKIQISNYCKDPEINAKLFSKFFQTKINMPTKSGLLEVQLQAVSVSAQESPLYENRRSFNLKQNRQAFSQNSGKKNPSKERSQQLSTKVVRKIKEYSSFSYQICNYLQNFEETTNITLEQMDFIKNYLIAHLIENQLEKVMGIANYFSNSIMEIICMPSFDFTISHDLCK